MIKRTTEWCNECGREITFRIPNWHLGGIAICKCGNAMPFCNLCDCDKVNCYECSLALACKKLNKDRKLRIPKAEYQPTFVELEEYALQR